MVLGEDLVNPFTGLSVRDYLDGREGTHKEMRSHLSALNKLEAGGKRKGDQRSPDALLRAAADAAFGEYVAARDARDDVSSYVGDADAALFGGRAAMERLMGKMLEEREKEKEAFALPPHLARAVEAHGGTGLGRDPYAEETDTRFETDSDQMELCDLNEIM